MDLTEGWRGGCSGCIGGRACEVLEVVKLPGRRCRKAEAEPVSQADSVLTEQ